jgi:hypothetical protein
MTEAEWLAWKHPQPMLRFLLGTNDPRVQDVEAFPDCKGSGRKMRLFACACYHRIRRLLPNPLARVAVEVAEQVADGVVPAQELGHFTACLRRSLDALEGRWRASRGAERRAILPTHEALALGLVALWEEAPKAAYYASSNAYLAFAGISHPGAVPSDPRFAFSQAAEEKSQADILRCIFGHLFRPPTIVPAVPVWNDGTARKLAQSIYEERAFDRLPILADALEDAGCTDAAILEHCRGPGPHVRGCWAVDLLLGKS